MQELKMFCLDQAVFFHTEHGESDPNTVLNTAKAFYSFCTEERENTLTVERSNRPSN